MPGVSVTALCDGHDVWPDGYDAAFAAEEHIPVVCKRPEELLDHVDAAMIHGANWDRHVDKALIFLEAGIPVLIDKPVVGNLRDRERLLEAQARSGVLVYGGSSLRCAVEVTAMRERIVSRDRLLTVMASGPGDFFSYGIHTTEMLQGCIGIGVRSVTCVGDHRAPLFVLRYDNGFTALVQLQTPRHQWWMAASTDEGLVTATVDPDRLYEPFLRNFIALLRNEPVEYSLTGPLEAVSVHIAADIARNTGGEVFLDRLVSTAGFDGTAYAAAYAAAKRT
jgi:predicted dehydrogenase